MKHALAILSGGLDSMVACGLFLKEGTIGLALTFNYGQRAYLSELKAAQAFCKLYSIPHQVIEVDWMKSISQSALHQSQSSLQLISQEKLDEQEAAENSAKAVWVPNRNALFINIAACFAESMGAQYLLVGFNKEEAQTFPDNSSMFVEAMNKTLFYSTQNQVKVYAPLIDFNKKEIVEKALQAHLPLELTWSCYESRLLMCGVCESCLRAKRAYESAGLHKLIQQKFEEVSL